MSAPVRVGLVDACDDPRLLGLELWPRQRELLAAVETGPRLHVWALGRRSGKSTMAALVGLWSCLLRPELLERLRPRERGYAVSIATNLRQARLIVQAARSIIEGSPLLAELVEDVSEDTIVFRNGTAFSAFPCSARGARGWPIFSLTMDEAGHFLSETEGPMVADRVWTALAPSTAQFGDLARIIVCSTPYGEDGFFAKLYGQAAAGELDDAVAQHAATVEVNPMVDEAFLAREEARDPDAYRGEYLAEFLASGSAFLDLERVTIADRGVLPREACPTWVAGLDPAFQSDPFGLCLVGLDTQTKPALLRVGYADSLLPLKGVGSFDQRIGEIVDVLGVYGVRVAATDQHASAAITDRLAAAGIQCRVLHQTASSKTDAYVQLRGALYTHRLELFQHSTLLAELRRLRTRFSAGSSMVVNPRVGRSHGDVASALAYATQLALELDGRGGVTVTCGFCGYDNTGLPFELQCGCSEGGGSEPVVMVGGMRWVGEQYIDKDRPRREQVVGYTRRQ